MKRIFPKDMGFEIEESGSSIRFLTTWITVCGASYVCELYPPNYDFILFRSTAPKVSRCPHFIDIHHTPLKLLRHFLLPHLFTLHHICGSNRMLCYKHVACLCIEALRSGWTSIAVYTVLHDKSLQNRALAFDIAGHLGRKLRTCDNYDFLAQLVT